jgi:hypothetical protein
VAGPAQRLLRERAAVGFGKDVVAFAQCAVAIQCGEDLDGGIRQRNAVWPVGLHAARGDSPDAMLDVDFGPRGRLYLIGACGC